MKVKLKTAFSILDGRLSTKIDDVYEMLNYIFDAQFFTHQLPTAMRKLEEVNPEWYQNGKSVIHDICRAEKTDDFNELMRVIDNDFSDCEIELGKVDFHVPFSAGLTPKEETK